MTPQPPRRGRVLLLGIAAGAGLLLIMMVVVFLVGEIARRDASLPALTWDWQPTAGPLLGPPVAPFAAVDPAIIGVLTAGDAVGAPNPLQVLPEVAPVGAYFPPTTAGGWPTLAPTITPSPQPTVPLLEPPEDSGILPTEPGQIIPPGGGAPITLGGEGCAPRGLPTGGILTQRFHAWHSGVDFGIPVGTPVYATHSGQVLFAGWSTIGYGNLVIIQNGPFITYYAHLSGFNVVTGQVITAGTLIAASGNTGNSSGPHIHYEVRVNDVPVDPLTFDERGYPWC